MTTPGTIWAMSAQNKRGISLGVRITSAMVILAALVLATSGAVLYLLERGTAHDRVDDTLTAAVEEVHALMDTGVDPETGQPFASVRAFLRTYLSRTVMESTESEIGYVGTIAAIVAPEDVNLRPETDPELTAELEKWVEGDRTIMGTTHTSVTTWRWVVVPVVYPTEVGAVVRVIDIEAELAPLGRSVLFYGASAAMILLAAVVVSILTIKRLLRPIEKLRDAAESIDRRDLSARVPVRGNDDLTRLSLAMNQMLDRVEDAMTAQKELLSDVGHELRTPITIVRGHLELVDATDPADVESTNRLAIGELDRMGSLLNDLILLAAAREADFVTPVTTSVAELVAETFDKARALGNRQWRLGNLVDIDVMLDPVRITQAVLQLANNAVKYSAEGSAIMIDSQLVGQELGISVRDQGVGIPEAELETIRQRFARAESAHLHAKGSGLGLSIVESIVAGHNGRLDIVSTVGVGSVFTIVIPTVQPEGEQP